MTDTSRRVCTWCGSWTERPRVIQWVDSAAGPDRPIYACPLCPPGRAEQIASVTVLAALIVTLVYAFTRH